MRAADVADAQLLALAERLGPEELERPVERDGQRYAAGDLLLQALTHAHQHRTQVAAAVDGFGRPVTRTDYIDFLDETRDR